MTSLRMIQLAGFAIAAAGLGFMFFSGRQRLGRALSAAGGLIVVAGYAASPEFRILSSGSSPSSISDS